MSPAKHILSGKELNTSRGLVKEKILMANIANASILSPIDGATPHREREAPRLGSRIALGAILLLSIFLNFFQLGQNGYGNLYYAAAVRSMADNFHNFFFASFDPGGFVTIDKPPLGFWLQTLSTKLFGFTPFSIFLPQALCGVLAVWLLYYLVRRHFGVIAGLVAALALAVSPISVVTNRNNTIDGTLALVLLLAAWAVIHAAETGKLRWLLLSGVFVGIGFNIKMAEAYLVVPALVMTYLLCAPRKLWTRTWHLLLVGLVMLAISLSWAVAVDLTPVPQRPYVGSTQDNSELSLAFGYNGLNRLHIGGNGYGRNRAGANFSIRDITLNHSSSSGTSTSGTEQNGTATSTQNAGGSPNQQPSPPQGNNNNENAGGSGNTFNRTQPFQGGGNAFQLGLSTPLRLFSVSLGGQIAWLLPFALLAIVALLWQGRFDFQRNRQQQGLVLWGFWLLTMAIFFTLNGVFHQYYLTEMAPGLSALVGIGLVVMWRDYRSVGWRGWLLPIALIVTAVAQISMLTSYPLWAQWLSPLIGILTALAVIALIFFRLRQRLHLSGSVFHVAGLAVGIGMLALLVAPATWAGYSVIHDTESSFPTAGPPAQSGFGGFPGGNSQGAGGARRGFSGAPNGFGGQTAAFFDGNAQISPTLISYLEAHQGNTRFLVATPSSFMADSIILATNKPVMAMGGFSGGDPILTTSDLQTLINNGTVRFFLINSPRATQDVIDRIPEQYRDEFAGRGGGFNFGGFGQSVLSTWISSHCTPVPSSDWQSSTGNADAGLGGSQLYDCASPHS
jgi:4-amino-4-deoxy-L-arabinose transferase-like glycosyltransferase